MRRDYAASGWIKGIPLEYPAKGVQIEGLHVEWASGSPILAHLDGLSEGRKTGVVPIENLAGGSIATSAQGVFIGLASGAQVHVLPMSPDMSVVATTEVPGGSICISSNVSGYVVYNMYYPQLGNL